MEPRQSEHHVEDQFIAESSTSPGYCVACGKKIPRSGRGRVRVQCTSLGGPVCDLDCWDEVEAEL